MMSLLKQIKALSFIIIIILCWVNYVYAIYEIKRQSWRILIYCITYKYDNFWAFYWVRLRDVGKSWVSKEDFDLYFEFVIRFLMLLSHTIPLNVLQRTKFYWVYRKFYQIFLKFTELINYILIIFDKFWSVLNLLILISQKRNLSANQFCLVSSVSLFHILSHTNRNKQSHCVMRKSR